MEGFSRKSDEGCRPQLLDLIPREKKWIATKKGAQETNHGFSEEKKLELSLGPPGGYWSGTIKDNSNNNKNHVSGTFGYFSNIQNTTAVKKESSQPCNNNNRAVEMQSSAANTAQKRTAPAPVVGWPPIRSFRKNLASGSSSKSASESQNPAPAKIPGQKQSENTPKTLFVKINMDGIPIGRKVDLKAHDSYEKLSYAVDELFRGLLAAQSDCGIKKEDDEDRKKMGGLLDGSGEYTLVYEDNEGDRMLVGDVPWHMFVSTVKRLRVLKSSELPSLSRGSKQGKISLHAA